MEIRICETPMQMGQSAAAHIALILRTCIERDGSARILLSTGASQFETIDALVKENLDWSKVEMFHLDEYVGLPETHKASFRKYLKERFISKVNLKRIHLIDGTSAQIAELNCEIERAPINIGLIGIGENAHIAFNDPPADFDCAAPYITVFLNDSCKAQQVREGWFQTINDVPDQAVSMTVRQILKCEIIISCVPHSVKARAIFDMLHNGLSNQIPATALKNHKSFILYLDKESSELLLKQPW